MNECADPREAKSGRRFIHHEAGTWPDCHGCISITPGTPPGIRRILLMDLGHRLAGLREAKRPGTARWLLEVIR